jgi:hypothetical protein
MPPVTLQRQERSPCSPETSERIKAGQRRRMEEGRHNFHSGHHVPDEWKEAQRQRQTGRKLSAETRQKMSDSHKRANRKGEKRSDAAREKMRQSQLGKKQSPESVEKRAAALRGRQMPEAHRRKISAAHRAKRPITKPDESKAWKNRIEYKLWREAVYSRDGWTCQKYGTRGGHLHPHHILNFAQHQERRFDVDNGITLSVKAHREFHRKYGQRNNTEAQILEFLGLEKLPCR